MLLRLYTNIYLVILCNYIILCIVLSNYFLFRNITFTGFECNIDSYLATKSNRSDSEHTARMDGLRQSSQKPSETNGKNGYRTTFYRFTRVHGVHTSFPRLFVIYLPVVFPSCHGLFVVSTRAPAIDVCPPFAINTLCSLTIRYRQV